MLSGWNKDQILKFTIDHKKIMEDLTDFPVLLNITDDSGINDFDCSDVFDKLDEQSITDEFSGNNNDPPNPDIWINNAVYDSSRTQYASQISNNRLKQYVPHNTSDENECTVKSTFSLSGDFDIQIDYDCSGSVPDGLGACGFILRDVDNTRIAILRRENGTVRYATSTTSTSTSTSYVYESSKWRITRTGTTINQYVWQSSTSSWVSLESYNAPSAKNVYIFLRTDNWGGDYPEWTVYFDNFKINSGTVIWSPNTHLNSKKIAVVYPSVQKHWVDAVNDNFHGNNNDTPNTGLWDVCVDLYNNGKERVEPYIYDNHLKFVLTGEPDDRGNIVSKYKLKGDFCIETVFDLSDNVDCNFIAFYYWKDLDNRGNLTIKPYSDTLTAWSNVGGTGSSTNISLTISNIVTLRLERIGSTITFYYRNGEHADLVYAAAKAGITDDVNVVIRCDSPNSSTNTSTVYVNCFNLIYGEIDWDNNDPVMELEEYNNGNYTQLYCEIERWDHSNKSAQLWVKVPRVLSNQPTDLFLYYDKTQSDNTNYVGYTNSTPAEKVWDADFTAVYHLSQDPSTGGACILDSTSNHRHGTPQGSMTSSDVVDSCTGKGLEFDGTDDYISIPTNTINNTTFTLEGIIKSSTTPCLIVARGASGESVETNLLEFFNQNGSVRNFFETGAGSNHDFTINVPDNIVNDEYQYRADTRFNDYWTTFTELVFATTDTGATPDSTAPCYIGNDGLDKFFKGVMDEVRISKTQRSYYWLRASQHSKKDTLCCINEADIYYFTGHVYEKDIPVQKEVYLYDRHTGELMDKCMSTVSGTYYLRTTASGEHNVVCHAPDGYYDVILGRVLPDELN